MGAKLTAIIAFVKEKEGLQGVMRLAMKTGVPSNKAEETPDSPDLIAKATAAAKEITGAAPPA